MLFSANNQSKQPYLIYGLITIQNQSIFIINFKKWNQVENKLNSDHNTKHIEITHLTYILKTFKAWIQNK